MLLIPPENCFTAGIYDTTVRCCCITRERERAVIEQTRGFSIDAYVSYLTAVARYERHLLSGTGLQSIFTGTTLRINMRDARC